jgi:AraC-like DNA-binding protein
VAPSNDKESQDDERGCGPTVEWVAGTTARAVAVELLPHLRRARDHIDAHFAEQLGLERLAGVAGVSKYHFVRTFQASYGETPIRYLTRRRIERAQDLLRSANLTITEICVLVGFSSLGSFSARFSELVGESPSAYRSRWAATGGPHIPGCYLFVWGLRPIKQSERSMSYEYVPTVSS